LGEGAPGITNIVRQKGSSYELPFLFDWRHPEKGLASRGLLAQSVAMIVFSRDEAFVQLLEKTLGRLQVIEGLDQLDRQIDGERADAIIIDRDDHIDGSKALKAIRSSDASCASPCIAEVNGNTPPVDAQDEGAWFVIEKASLWQSPQRLAQWLREVRRREHFRFPISDLALLDSGGLIGRQVKLVNISLGGASFVTRGVEELEPHLTLRLSAGRFPCAVVWKDASGKVGVRFLDKRFTQDDLRQVLGTRTDG
jgi:hypothetical protein